MKVIFAESEGFMKISKLLKICCAGMLSAGAMAICFAEDMPTENFREMRQRGQRGMRQRGQRGMRGQGISGMPRMRMDVFGLDRINKESAIRAKFPAEMAELEKAKAELDAKYKALAVKAGVEIAETYEDKMRKLRAADAAAFDAAVAKFGEDRRVAMKELRELAVKHNIELFPARRKEGEKESSAAPVQQEFRRSRPNLGALRRKYPEEMKKYEELREKDRKAARTFLMELMEKDAAGAKNTTAVKENK